MSYDVDNIYMRKKLFDQDYKLEETMKKKLKGILMSHDYSFVDHY